MRRRVILWLIIGMAFFGPTPASATLPTAPSDVTVSSTSASGTAAEEARVKVAWTAVSDAIGYVVRYRTGSDTYTALYVNLPSGNQAQIDGLIGGRSYNFIVSSYNASGERAASTVSFTPRSVPKAPTVNSADAGVGQVTLKWTAAASDETGGLNLSGYLIESDQGKIETVSATTTEKVIDGLTAGSTHNFTLKAFNSLGYSIATTFEAAVVFNRPGAPTGVTLAVSGRTLTTSWTSPGSDGGSPVTGYKVYLVSVATGLDVDSKTTNSTTTNTTFTSVVNGNYNVRVVATNLVGESDRSIASTDRAVDVTVELLDNSPIFSPNNVESIPVGDTLNLRVTSPSGDTPTVTVTGTPNNACTYSNGILTAVLGGSCSIRATVSASGNYGAGDTSLVISLTKLSQSITFPAIADQGAPSSITVAATASSGLSPTFSVSGNCSIAGNTVTTQSGRCTVTASQSGDFKFAVATPVERSFAIAGGGAGGIGGGGVVVSAGGAVATTTVVETKTASTSVVLRVQVVDPLSQTSFLNQESCVGVKSVIAQEVADGDRCVVGSTIADFTLKDGEYRISVIDPSKKRGGRTFSLSIEKGVITIPEVQVASLPTRYLLPAGAIIPVTVETSATVVRTVETKTTTTVNTETKTTVTVQPESKTATTATKSDSNTFETKLEVKVISKAIKSSAPRVSTSSLDTLASAKNVARVGNVGESQQTLKNPIARPIQMEIQLSRKTNKVVIEVKPVGGRVIQLFSKSGLKKGDFLSPIIKFKKTGEYRITTTINGKRSILTVVARKK